MNKIFRTVDGVPVNVINHTLEILKKYPTVVVHIGTDSQTKSRKTKYSTVIAYRYGSRGVHYIYCMNIFPKIRDTFTRLFKEAELSLEIATWLSDQINLKIEIDMDYNSDESRFSNKLVDQAKGWALGLGYKVNIKPNNQIATKAADHHCR
jgi:predicted RNase H-related nuclease YkuK (DUF458 family)